jgi:hypothetical protein
MPTPSGEYHHGTYARRIAEVAAHPTDHVLPHLTLRQWVLSLPKRLRPHLHHAPRSRAPC